MGVLLLCALVSGPVASSVQPVEPVPERSQEEEAAEWNLVSKAALSVALAGTGAVVTGALFGAAIVAVAYARHGTLDGSLLLPIGPVDLRLVAAGFSLVGAAVGAQMGTGLAIAWLISE